MKAATKTSAVDQPGAHLRLVSDRTAGTPGIQLSGVSKTYRSRDGDVPSLRPLDFHINAGEFFVVVGPSGCGKSTLLKMISGLLTPSTGEIFVEGQQVTKPHGNVGIVFQNSLLLPWRNILANLMLPIDMKRLPRSEYLPRAMDLLKLVGLEGFEKKLPWQLSGGMQRSEEHTSELQSLRHLVCRLLLEKKKTTDVRTSTYNTSKMREGRFEVEITYLVWLAYVRRRDTVCALLITVVDNVRRVLRVV